MGSDSEQWTKNKDFGVYSLLHLLRYMYTNSFYFISHSTTFVSLCASRLCLFC